MRLIKGTDLTPKQRQEVLNAFVFRHLSGQTDEQWLAEHAFYFVKDGSRLAYNRPYAEPSWMVEMEEAKCVS